MSFHSFHILNTEGEMMIFGRVANINTEKHGFSAKLQVALEYIKNTDFTKLQNGKYEIDGDDIFATVSDYRTEPKAMRQPEAHRKYIDVQYVAAGRELIGCSFLAAGNKVAQPYSAERDLEFYCDAENEMFVTLTPDVYTILFPADVHRPGCALQESIQVRKVVVKIKI